MMRLKPFWLTPIALFALLLGAVLPWDRPEPPLPELNLDLSQTTVSGISSGAYMAVQLGVAHSAAVRGVAATAGGAYFCADSSQTKAITQCMQGDPAYPAEAIGAADMARMSATARAWAALGQIDGVDHLARQRVWLLHGYNDGIVKKPVSDALYQWYAGFAPASHIFYRDDLRAAHAQISAVCGPSGCQDCAASGGNFINACPAGAGGAARYDAAGAALQFFYGPLARTDSAALRGKLLPFDQRPFVHKDGEPVMPLRLSMAAAGYVYVPAECAAGAACRLHIAFHGCQQQAGKIGTAFVTQAGFNEWADANRIVVLYPQTAASYGIPGTPLNPQGCWDWWGYTDAGAAPGRYATQAGPQIAAVWRMAQRLAGKAGAAPAVAIHLPGAVPTLTVVDASARQVALTWPAQADAVGYAIYRDGQRIATVAEAPWVDGGVQAGNRYTYTLRAVDPAGKEGPAAQPVSVTTAPTPPACDPYFSLTKGRPVTRDNQPSDQTCP